MLLPLAFVTVVAAAATGKLLFTGGTGATQAAGASPSTPAAGSAAHTGGRAARDFTVQTAHGKTFRLAAQRGKVVVLDFLQPGCSDCETEVPALARAAQRFGREGVQVLVLDVGGLDNGQLRDFYYGRLQLGNGLVAADRDLAVAGSYRVQYLGTTIVVGRNGKVAWRGTWSGNEKLLTHVISQTV